MYNSLAFGQQHEKQCHSKVLLKVWWGVQMISKVLFPETSLYTASCCLHTVTLSCEGSTGIYIGEGTGGVHPYPLKCPAVLQNKWYSVKNNNNKQTNKAKKWDQVEVISAAPRPGDHLMEPQSLLISWVNPFPSGFINRTIFFWNALENAFCPLINWRKTILL